MQLINNYKRPYPFQPFSQPCHLHLPTYRTYKSSRRIATCLEPFLPPSTLPAALPQSLITYKCQYNNKKSLIFKNIPTQFCFCLIFALLYLFASSICEKRISTFKKTIKSDTKEHTRGSRHIMSRALPISISFWPFIGSFHAKYVLVVIYKKENIPGARDASHLKPPPALRHVAMSDGCNMGVVMVQVCRQLPLTSWHYSIY